MKLQPLLWMEGCRKFSHSDLLKQCAQRIFRNRENWCNSLRENVSSLSQVTLTHSTQLISLQTFLVNRVPIHTKMPRCLIIVKNSIEGLLWTSPNLQKSERNSYNKKSLVEKAKLTERLAWPKLASGIGTVLILNVFNKHSNVLISKGEPEANILRSLGNELFLNL